MDQRPRPGSLADRLQPSATVLVVEDDPDITTFLTAYFQASGGVHVEHLAPAEAEQVVRAVEQCAAGCVLLDLRLGKVSGFEVLDAMRAAGQVPGLPVVVVTADGRPATAERAVAAGATAVRGKPFNVKDLHALVVDLLRR